jgi:hypothetical protein
MPQRIRPAPQSPEPFDQVCAQLEDGFRSGVRAQILDGVTRAGSENRVLARFRASLAAHAFQFPPRKDASGRPLPPGLILRPGVRELERRSVREGFQVLRDWDGRAARFQKEIVSVDLLDWYTRERGARGAGGRPRGPAGARPPHGSPAPLPLHEGLGVVLDHYFLYLLALLSLRAWDAGDPNENLDRVAGLLADFQGVGGCEIPFLESVEGLFWIAISNYHPDDGAYDRILERVRGLNDAHRFRFSWLGASVLGTHLRWGFEAYYQRDLKLLRRDNFADYPWLMFSLATLMDRYHHLRSQGASEEARAPVVLALLNGITPDPPAFTGRLPASLGRQAEEQARFSALYQQYREDLHREFEPFRPQEARYSPLALHFNFPHNALKGMVGMRLLGWPVPRVPLEALFEDPSFLGRPEGAREALSGLLMEHSRANPEAAGNRRILVLAYNPTAGLRRYKSTLWGDLDPLEEEEREGADRSRLSGSPFQRGDTSTTPDSA